MISSVIPMQKYSCLWIRADVLEGKNDDGLFFIPAQIAARGNALEVREKLLGRWIAVVGILLQSLLNNRVYAGG